MYLSADKSSTSSPCFYGDIGYFGHAQLHSPKMTVSPCWRLWCLSASKNKLDNSLLSHNITFKRIVQFDWPAAFSLITGDPKLCHTCWWNISSNIIFAYRLFPRKTNMTKFFKKMQKTLFWGHSGHFLHKLGPKMNFTRKKGSVSFSIFDLSTIVPKIRKT